VKETTADTKVSEEGRRRRCLRCQSREPSLAACDEDHGEAGFPPAAHGGPQWSRYPPLARGRDPTPEQVGMPEGGCDPVGSPVLEQAPSRTCRPMERGAHARAGLLARLVTPWGPTLEQPVPEGLHPMGRTQAGAVSEELQPVGRSHIGEVCGELSAMRGTSCWSRDRV